MRLPLLAAAAGLFVAPALAKTDLGGCTSTQVVFDTYTSSIYYLPDTGEICDLIDCGGGTAPPKTTVPGCPGYEGTATVTPSFMSGWGESTSAVSTATATVSAAATTNTTKGDDSSSSGASETRSAELSSITTAPFQTGNGTVVTTVATIFTSSTGSGSDSGSAGNSTTSSSSAGSSSTLPSSAAAGSAAIQSLALVGGAAVAVAMAML